MPHYIYLLAALFFLILIRLRLRPAKTSEASAAYAKKLNRLTALFALLAIPLYILPAYVTDYLFYPLLYLFLWLILSTYCFSKVRSFNISRVAIAGYAFAGLLMAYALLIAYRGEFTEPNIAIKPDLVTIQAPGHICRFAPRDILNITATESIPACEKTNAFHSNHLIYGQFKLENGLPAELYLHVKSKPYIFIRLNDKVLMFNGKTSEETAGYFHLLDKARQASLPVQACNSARNS